MQAAIVEASAKFPGPPANYVPRYGTAGYRTEASLLASTMFRCGIMAAIRALTTAQVTGLCITASHNPAPDNGVKMVDPTGEMLAQRFEPLVDELAQAPSAEALARLVADALAAEGITAPTDAATTVLIAHDTRPSGPALAEAAAAGVRCMGGTPRLLGLLTTPQLHWAVMRTNQGLPSDEAAYCKVLSAAFLKLAGTATPAVTLHVDAANGVGGPKLAALAPALAPAGLLLELHNTGEGVLNGGCGSDFVQNGRQLPAGFDGVAPGACCCAVDGDADRLVYFYSSGADGTVMLLDGDKIAALAAGLIKDLVAALPAALAAASVGVVQTAYANGASSAYLKDAVGCEVAVTPTGVKHLHAAAHAFDVGIYFEANGHGTVLFKAKFLEQLRQIAGDSPAAAELLALDGVINAAVGDAVSGILLVEAALRRKGWGLAQWAGLYTDLPSRQVKVLVADRSVITTTDAERRVATPAALQDKIDELVAAAGPQARAFVRPSGTEDVVRVYAEAGSEADMAALAAAVAAAVGELAGGV